MECLLFIDKPGLIQFFISPATKFAIVVIAAYFHDRKG